MSGLARLRLGQSVYVRLDAYGYAIGVWGKVVRLRRADNMAWVELVTRHERCPFPESDATRSRHILAAPGGCSSVAPAPGLK
jgi:hypothetical protein